MSFVPRVSYDPKRINGKNLTRLGNALSHYPRFDFQ